jgi:hypothetical protein
MRVITVYVDDSTRKYSDAELDYNEKDKSVTITEKKTKKFLAKIFGIYSVVEEEIERAEG